MTLILKIKGGPGSGHRGHSGRPGSRGGSAPRSKRVSLGSLKKVTISQAASVIREAGYTLGRGKTVLKPKIVTSYEVTKPNGEKVSMTTDEIKMLMLEIKNA